MNRSETPFTDQMEDDDIPAEIDFSHAVRSNTAYLFGEDHRDEAFVHRFWLSLGMGVVTDLESGDPRAMAADFLLHRDGTGGAICEVKSMGEFESFITVNHEDGTSTTSGHRSLLSDANRALRLVNRAVEQFEYSNPERTLTRLFVFVNHLETLRREDLQAQLLAIPGIDATLWFDARDGVISPEATVITTESGQRKLQQLGLTVEVRLRMIQAA
jgi:hypothetical protein